MNVAKTILVSTVTGVVLGSVAAVVAYNVGDEIPLQSLSGISSTPSDQTGAFPRAELPETDFHFGRMRAEENGSHDFLVKNTGNAPLTLKITATSCKCTLGVATERPVPPGESTTVKMEWHIDGAPGPFRQTATLRTNDPRNPQIFLTIEGQISQSFSILPPEFHFDRISFDEGKSAQVLVLSFYQDELKLEGDTFFPVGKDEFFDVQVEPIQTEDLPDRDAKAGARVILTAKPGLPIGSLNQRLQLRTNLPDTPILEIPMTGRVVGEISVRGNDFDEERGLLRLGSVKSASGKTARLDLYVRGAGAADVKFQVASLDPPELSVTVGETRSLSDNLAHVRVDVAVPPGTPPMVRLGTAQGKEGRVTLKATHRSIHEISFGVRFTVDR